MKITMSSDGSQIIFDVADITEALELVAALRNGKVEEPVVAYVDDRGHYHAPTDVNVQLLTPALQEVYDYLNNERPDGINVLDLATTFGINKAAMEQRLRQLKKRGMAAQVSRGRWHTW